MDHQQQIRHSLQSGKAVVGMRQVQRGLNEGTVALVYLSQDCDPAFRHKMEQHAAAAGVPVRIMYSGLDYQHLCGLDVRAHCIGILKDEAK